MGQQLSQELLLIHGTTATFNPSSDLVTGTTYTATIKTGAKNLARYFFRTRLCLDI